jgi:AbrB family looped-hinge helix DNA binding protein
MSAKISFEFKNYGITTMGERGQIVIPKEIRKKLKIIPGEQFLVFCRDNAIIGLIKPQKFDKLIRGYISQLKTIKTN